MRAKKGVKCKEELKKYYSEIFDRYVIRKESLEKLAADFHVSKSTIRRIVDEYTNEHPELRDKRNERGKCRKKTRSSESKNNNKKTEKKNYSDLELFKIFTSDDNHMTLEELSIELGYSSGYLSYRFSKYFKGGQHPRQHKIFNKKKAETKAYKRSKDNKDKVTNDKKDIEERNNDTDKDPMHKSIDNDFTFNTAKKDSKKFDIFTDGDSIYGNKCIRIYDSIGHVTVDLYEDSEITSLNNGLCMYKDRTECLNHICDSLTDKKIIRQFILHVVKTSKYDKRLDLRVPHDEDLIAVLPIIEVCYEMNVPVSIWTLNKSKTGYVLSYVMDKDENRRRKTEIFSGYDTVETIGHGFNEIRKIKNLYALEKLHINLPVDGTGSSYILLSPNYKELLSVFYTLIKQHHEEKGGISERIIIGIRSCWWNYDGTMLLGDTPKIFFDDETVI